METVGSLLLSLVISKEKRIKKQNQQKRRKSVPFKKAYRDFKRSGSVVHLSKLRGD